MSSTFSKLSEKCGRLSSALQLTVSGTTTSGAAFEPCNARAFSINSTRFTLGVLVRGKAAPRGVDRTPTLVDATKIQGLVVATPWRFESSPGHKGPGLIVETGSLRLFTPTAR